MQAVIRAWEAERLAMPASVLPVGTRVEEPLECWEPGLRLWSLCNTLGKVPLSLGTLLTPGEARQVSAISRINT